MSKLDNLLKIFAKETSVSEISSKKTIRYTFLVPFILSAILGYYLFFTIIPSPKIGVVNINGIIDEFVKTQAKSGLSYEELRNNVKAFGGALEQIMHDISDKRHIVLMPAEAVIAGAKDYTDEVQKLLLKLPASKVAPSAKPNVELPQPLEQTQNNTQPPQDLMLESLKEKRGEGNQGIAQGGSTIQQTETDIAPSQQAAQFDQKPSLNEPTKEEGAVIKNQDTKTNLTTLS